MEKCPKCKSKDVKLIEIMEFDPDNIFGFSEDDYAAQKNRRCSSCQFEWRVEEKEKEYLIEELEKMKLSQIADVIFNDWRTMDPSALPYVEAMLNLEKVSDSFGGDDGESIILYFLTNAKYWKGETAQAVKKHLREIVGQ